MSDSRDQIPSDKTAARDIQKSANENAVTPATDGLSRRRLFGMLVGSAAALSAGFALMQSEPADAQSKTPKKVAKYQDHPKGSQQCSSCRFFKAPNSCQLVAGKISPNGWCSFYAKKS